MTVVRGNRGLVNRRNVVLEGPDGGGKSTLAEQLTTCVAGLRLQLGAGPPRAPGEIEARLASYLKMEWTLFDRHPAISQPIYAALRGELLSPEFVAMAPMVYANALIIYCRSTTPERHVVKPGENPEHVRKLTERYGDLLRAYDSWACERADIIYRIGQTDSDEIYHVVRTVLE